MKCITLHLAQGSPHAPMVQHLVESYAQWWGIALQVEVGVAANWKLVGVNSLHIAADSQALIPDRIAFVSARCGGVLTQLPFPHNGFSPPVESGALPETLPEDLLAFLCGQLWRAEELLPALQNRATEADHRGFLGERFAFFDKPIVDLWMRCLFEAVLGVVLEPAGKPRFWLTFDVDCLRKWRTLGVFKHIALLPKYVLQKKRSLWFSLIFQALRSWSPRNDPWFTIPRMLDASSALQATFFFMGHPRDHRAYRYDVRSEVNANAVRRVLESRHLVGLHGSPLHRNSPVKLSREKEVLEGVAQTSVRLHRQHYLSIVPGKTLRSLDAIGITLDSTMGFNGRTGFRCGSCIPIRWWDLQQNHALALVELPFVLGDWTLHDPLHFDVGTSLHKIQELLAQVQLAGGILTMIFHDLYFASDYPGHAEFFAQVLRMLAQQDCQAWSPE